MEKLQKLHYKGKEILMVDYSDCSGDSLISVFETARDLILEEKRPYLILTIFNNKTYLNQKFMSLVQEELPKFDEYVDKQAIVGLTEVQQWILKALNLWYKRQIVYFDSMDKAIEFLAKEVDQEVGRI